MDENKINCQLNITALVSCPHDGCDCIFDLFDIQGLTEDGYLFNELLSDNGFGKKSFGEIVQCPECKQQITIGDVSW